MKTILVPTDFSDSAAYALDYACLVAEKTNAKIILLHVIPHAEVEASQEGEWMKLGWAGEKFASASVPAIMDVMRHIKKKMSSLMHQPQCRKIAMADFIEIGKISPMIIAASRRHKADMIVMGTRGTSGLNEIFLGSNAEKVVRDADVPVLTVQEKKEKVSVKNIVFATDFSEETDLVFSSVKNFADIFNASIHVVKIMSAPRIRKRMEQEKALREFEVEHTDAKLTTHIYYHDTKETGIRNFAETVKADLIALGTHGRHGLARFFTGSVAEELVNHSLVPVLTINFHKKQLAKAVSKTEKTPQERLEETVMPETMISGHVPSV